jgi:hypothetical protein
MQIRKAASLASWFQVSLNKLALPLLSDQIPLCSQLLCTGYYELLHMACPTDQLLLLESEWLADQWGLQAQCCNPAHSTSNEPCFATVQNWVPTFATTQITAPSYRLVAVGQLEVTSALHNRWRSNVLQVAGGSDMMQKILLHEGGVCYHVCRGYRSIRAAQTCSVLTALQCEG